jgi:uncharacterized damage-inducible protein DinB
MSISTADTDLITHYENGGHQLRAAVQGLDDTDLRATPIPGKWSTHQLVIHLADAEAAFADRARRIIAMPDPQLMGWDETEFIAALHYEQQSAEDALVLIETTRRQLARVLKAIPPAAWDRAGVHSEMGRQTLRQIIERAVGHLAHHLKFVAEKREAMGKLMW